MVRVQHSQLPRTAYRPRCCHRNRTVSREELARELWKEPSILTNVIDVTVKQLRRKIERPNERPLIWTIRGVGYELRDEAGDAE